MLLWHSHPVSSRRWRSKASDDKKNAVKVAREVLARYVGSYEFRTPEDPQPMIPLSETVFAASGGRIEFVPDDKGRVTHAIFRIVEGDLQGVRK